MLSFFRKIRRSLIGSHRVKNYFLYAVGEVALVMIGILLALQINTWNQGRINKMEEKRILAAVADEINNYRWQIKVGQDRFNEVLASSGRLILWMNDPESNIPKDSIDQDLSLLTSRWLMGMSNESNIYDALTGAGELGLVSSDELRTQLGYLKREMMLLASYETFQTNFVDNHLFPFLNQNFDGVGIIAIRSNIRKNRNQFNPNPVIIPIDKGRFGVNYDALKNNQYFSNLLVQHMTHTSALLPIYRRLGACVNNIDTILASVDPLLIEG